MSPPCSRLSSTGTAGQYSKRPKMAAPSAHETIGQLECAAKALMVRNSRAAVGRRPRRLVASPPPPRPRLSASSPRSCGEAREPMAESERASAVRDAPCGGNARRGGRLAGSRAAPCGVDLTAYAASCPPTYPGDTVNYRGAPAPAAGYPLPAPARSWVVAAGSRSLLGSCCRLPLLLFLPLAARWGWLLVAPGGSELPRGSSGRLLVSLESILVFSS
ncbi:unnamed protein product [Lampetra planeri]